MITNERQYKITKAQAQKFHDAIEEYDLDGVISAGYPPEIAQAQLDQMNSEYENLIEQLKEYDDLSSGDYTDFSGASLEELPLVLIKARIARNWTQKVLADMLKIKEQQVQRYESELYASCSLSTLIRIADTLGLEITENAIFSDNAEQLSENFPFNEIYNRGWFVDYHGSLNMAKRSKSELIESFYVNSGVTQNQLALHKKKVRAGSVINEYSLSAWQTRVIYLSRLQKLPTKFNPDYINMEWFRELVKLSVHNDGPMLAMNFLLSAGIHFIVEKHLKHTHLDGAAIRHPDGATPIIACTLRYDRLDNFWFVLFHELAHLYLHFNSKDIDYFDSDIEGDSNDIEKEADDFALNALLPNNIWDTCLSRFSLSVDTVRHEAKQLQIHPSIIAGRIRKEQNNYMILNEAVGYGEVRNQFFDDRSSDMYQ